MYYRRGANMSNYNISRLFLENVQYKFTKPDRKDISISLIDNIKVVEIHENEAILNVERTLNFDARAESFVKVNYEIVVKNDNVIEKQDLTGALSNKKINLTIVYSRASLLISQITSMSPFGVIITPPSYDSKINIVS